MGTRSERQRGWRSGTAILAMSVLLGAACGSGETVAGTDASATCREYLGWTDEDRGMAVRTIGSEVGWADAGSPFAVVSLDAHCAQRLDQTLEQAIGLFADDGQESSATTATIERSSTPPQEDSDPTTTSIQTEPSFADGSTDIVSFDNYELRLTASTSRPMVAKSIVNAAPGDASLEVTVSWEFGWHNMTPGRNIPARARIFPVFLFPEVGNELACSATSDTVTFSGEDQTSYCVLELEFDYGFWDETVPADGTGSLSFRSGDDIGSRAEEAVDAALPLLSDPPIIGIAFQQPSRQLRLTENGREPGDGLCEMYPVGKRVSSYPIFVLRGELVAGDADCSGGSPSGEAQQAPSTGDETTPISDWDRVDTSDFPLEFTFDCLDPQLETNGIVVAFTEVTIFRQPNSDGIVAIYDFEDPSTADLYTDSYRQHKPNCLNVEGVEYSGHEIVEDGDWLSTWVSSTAFGSTSDVALIRNSPTRTVLASGGTDWVGSVIELYRPS